MRPLIESIEGSFFCLRTSMPDFAQHIARLLQSYTYPAVFILVMLECLGIPLPGEIALVTAAAYASHGQISIYIVVALAALGATIGGMLGYWIGIKGGLPLLAHYGRYIGVKRSHIDRAHAWREPAAHKTDFVLEPVLLLQQDVWRVLAQVPGHAQACAVLHVDNQLRSGSVTCRRRHSG